MNFGFGMGRQLVKDLRKNKGYTVIELANHLKIDSSEIKRVDPMKLKDVPEPLKSMLIPIFRGDAHDKMPW